MPWLEKNKPIVTNKNNGDKINKAVNAIKKSNIDLNMILYIYFFL
ncbi:hypothetical protein HJ01_00326 [Flavobacterium frigoris PS1]|uniref:Uncharacterized protein n=1 Tax=Flavobacterium frigoris (strain PS1) TaxID=1086011 RepID=H7FML9_FLAFP|nr:hypothetical protein HJ01_00326 [Flavobacterium frigoris PS1]